MRQVVNLCLALAMCACPAVAARGAAAPPAPGALGTLKGTFASPFTSLEAARDAARAIKKERGGVPADGIDIALRGGVYVLTAPPEAVPQQPVPVTDLAAALEEVLPESPKRLGDSLPDWVRYEFLGVAIWQFIAAFLLVLLGLALRKVSDYVFEKRIIPTLQKTRFNIDHLLSGALTKPLGCVILLGALALAVWVLALPTEPTNVRAGAFGALKVLLVADVLWLLFRLVDVLAVYLTRLAGRSESELDDQLVPLVRKALKVTIGLLLAVWVVQLLGYSVTSLLAGLGIGGLAVALALQDTLGNFFGSIFIFIDRPFLIGDMVKMGDVEGTVERIGFRSTRIRTWPATLVCIPNKTVAEATIDNWSKMPKRRVLQTIGVTYETTADQMQEAVAAIREVLAGDEGVDQEFIVVRFSGFGASSLDITIYYFTKAVAYADHLETRERVNLAIMRAVADLGLEIAFPTRTVYFEGDLARGMAGQKAINPNIRFGVAPKGRKKGGEK